MINLFPEIGGAAIASRIRPERRNIWKVVIGVFTVFTILTLYAFEVRWFNSTFEARSLILRSLGIGVLIGGIIAWQLLKHMDAGLEKVQIAIFIISLIALSMPLFGSLSNRLLSFQPIQMEPVEYVKTDVYGASRFGTIEGQVKADGYYTFIIRKDKIERIKTREALFLTHKRSDIVNLPVKKGFWAYEFVFL